MGHLEKSLYNSISKAGGFVKDFLRFPHQHDPHGATLAVVAPWGSCGVQTKLRATGQIHFGMSQSPEGAI